MAAEPKFAVVRVTEIFRNLPSTAATQREMEGRRATIMGGERAESIRKIYTELEAMKKSLEANRGAIDTEEGKKAAREYEIKGKEAEAMRKDFDEFGAEQDKKMSGEMVALLRSSLGRIMEAANKIAQERGLQGVMDISGDTNTGIPFLLYHGSTPDITDDVFDLIGEKAAAVPELKEVKPAAEPAKTPE